MTNKFISKALIAEALIIVGALVFEGNIYGSILSGFILSIALWFGFLVVVFLEFVTKRKKLKSKTLFSIVLPLFYLLFFKIIFSNYLSDGTMYLHRIALVLNGNVTAMGYGIVLFYSLITTLALIILTDWRDSNG